jgi:hypothetical protein
VLTGKGVKTQRPASGAVASKIVTPARTVELPIKPKGKAKHQLDNTGKVKVKVTVTYTPNGTSSGDVVGDSNKDQLRSGSVRVSESGGMGAAGFEPLAYEAVLSLSRSMHG